MLKYFKFFILKLAGIGKVYLLNKMNRFLPFVLVILVLLLSSCSERSEYGETSDYEKLGAVSTDTTAPTISSLSPNDNSTYNSPATTVAVTFSNKMATGSVTTNTSDTSLFRKLSALLR